MPSTSDYTKLRVLALQQQGKSYKNIVTELKSEGISITRQTVSSTIKRYEKNKTLSEKERTGRKRILTVDQLNFIDEQMHQNDELTSTGM